jgi:hypothetical protein
LKLFREVLHQKQVGETAAGDKLKESTLRPSRLMRQQLVTIELHYVAQAYERLQRAYTTMDQAQRLNILYQ